MPARKGGKEPQNNIARRDPIRSEITISVVMPSFNQGAYLEAAIASVLSQDYPKVELVVIDGGSTDDSRDILQRHDREIAYWVSEPDRGQSDALNKGFRRISGDIVGWLNSDDVYRPGAFTAVAEAFAGPTVGLAMSRRFGFIDADGRATGAKENFFDGYETLIRWWATHGMTINQPSVFFRRSLIADLDPVLDEDLHYAMDYDLWLRLTRENALQVVDGHWADYRYHGSSKTVEEARRFVPEWYAVSQRHWGPRFGPSWWRHRLDYLLHWQVLRPMRIVASRLTGGGDER